MEKTEHRIMDNCSWCEENGEIKPVFAYALTDWVGGSEWVPICRGCIRSWIGQHIEEAVLNNESPRPDTRAYNRLALIDLGII